MTTIFSPEPTFFSSLKNIFFQSVDISWVFIRDIYSSIHKRYLMRIIFYSFITVVAIIFKPWYFIILEEFSLSPKIYTFAIIYLIFWLGIMIFKLGNRTQKRYTDIRSNHDATYYPRLVTNHTRAALRQKHEGLSEVIIWNTFQEYDKPRHKDFMVQAKKVHQEFSYSFEKDKMLRAHHEAGHAVIGAAMGLAVTHCTININTGSGGHTIFEGMKTNSQQDSSYVQGWHVLVSNYGGIMSERLLNGNVSFTSCESDIQHALNNAHQICAARIEIPGVPYTSADDLMSEASECAEKIAQKHQEKIKEVAQEIMNKTTLDTEALALLLKDIVPAKNISRNI